MSRIGKKPIQLPEGVSVKKDGDVLVVNGPKGELKRKLIPDIDVEMRDKVFLVKLVGKSKKGPAFWGLYRALAQNMVQGVKDGFYKKLEIEGIGFKVLQEGQNLVFSLGLSHPVKFEAPPGIQFKVEKNVVMVSGIDKELVGDTAARIRKLKEPEPYKGKGIHYAGEVIRRKAGKKAVAATA
ncbi:MAG: 50S ribosomal protein L6 [Candidatus Sungbacteria bacterium RIFCSPLOWO2_12_FULL_41_11]|uniref:Large ribosomal subunit protein uL6 n=1 Tax=Candidatus Sungbacteria bacterium RIFCSPLOWO2_12_FULL_41_11 TaxID=1802286 RepID=A0A1G2LST7_9BACT|nr:MAG: 50S ribosomal protein L6 [Parcubacteria group bacterium GW2011_GWA2_42_14]OGZ98405.1 MAG: 50S ribosomal protein L6 [Candidatus Sungbacteria bacterium RIFCSPHIGHO2_02_FULL_41_12b]OHA13929.1 MAG: 50S ribosomal protein L6 [Candidatus Sungbacteria bacterium RIFCSPLOWO2_12_FULL_41_11]